MGQKRKRGKLATASASAAGNTANAVTKQKDGEVLSKSALAKSKRRKRTRVEELGGDTPKGFLNLINYQDKVAQVRRDTQASDKWKKDAKAVAEASKLVRRTGENLRDFSRRVDAALPVRYSKSSDQKIDGVEDFAEKRRKKQAARQKQQNEEHLNMLRKKHERKFETTDKDFDDYEFAVQTKIRGRQKSPDPWAVLLRPERQYKFNETVEAPPVLNSLGKLVKKVEEKKKEVRVN